MSFIVAIQLSRSYGSSDNPVQALKPTNLSLEAGELVMVVGPSGSGKTTLMNLVAGIDTPSSGELIIDGHKLHQLKSPQLLEYRRQKVALVFQFHHLIPNLTAWENIELVASMVRGGGDIKGALEMVGLGARGHHFPHQLSGGEQQRVAIARALVKDSPLLLGDEPTGNLDGTNGRQVLKLFCEARARGKTVLLVTHNLAHTSVANRVITMADGCIVSDQKNSQPEILS